MKIKADTPLPQRGEGVVSLGKRDVKMKVDFKALSRIEEKLGGSVLIIVKRAGTGDIRSSDLALVLHECAVSAGEKLTYDECGDLLVQGGIIMASPVIMDILAQAVM